MFHDSLQMSQLQLIFTLYRSWKGATSWLSQVTHILMMQAKLVRHWQHHPVSMPPVSKFRLGPVRDRLGACRSTASAYVDPVVMSKVQHYLNSSSAGPAPAGMPASAADRVVAPVDTAGRSPCSSCWHCSSGHLAMAVFLCAG